MIAQRHTLQFQIGAIFNPPVAETTVAHRVLEGYPWYVCLMSFAMPTSCNSQGLVHEALAAFQLGSLVIINVIANGIVEVDIQPETFKYQSTEDIAVEVRVGISYDSLVRLIYSPVVVHIFKVYITCAEVLAIDTILSHLVKLR